MAGIVRKTCEIIVYAVMLILIAICFTGKGLFIYEAF
ncbi:MAG: hypothetical protein K0Q59_1464 [Paenibacillus sp.]|jgi:hypothetical protein|nr:hypothetical protein [Paenibacillus sp.]